MYEGMRLWMGKLEKVRGQGWRYECFGVEVGMGVFDGKTANGKAGKNVRLRIDEDKIK